VSRPVRLEELVWAIDPDQPVANIPSIEERMAEGVAQRRFNMLLFGIFGGQARLLAVQVNPMLSLRAE
jgi:hypothetical protein